MREKRCESASSFINGQPRFDLVLSYFETVGAIIGEGVVDPELVWYSLYQHIVSYYALASPQIQKDRERDQAVWGNLTALHDTMIGIEVKKRRCELTEATPKKKDLSAFIVSESNCR
jgi:hypothetical protein